MALVSGIFFSGFTANSTMTGPASPQLFGSVDLAISQWVISGGVSGLTPGKGGKVLSVPSGSAGAGLIQGKLLCPPPVLPSLLSIAQVCGLSGPAAADVVRPIAMGTQQGLLAAQYTGVSTGVSTGVEQLSILSVDRNSLFNFLYSNLVSNFGATGKAIAVMCTALTEVIAAIVLTCTGIGVVIPTGPVTPAAVVGKGENIVIF